MIRAKSNTKLNYSNDISTGKWMADESQSTLSRIFLIKLYLIYTKKYDKLSKIDVSNEIKWMKHQ